MGFRPKLGSAVSAVLNSAMSADDIIFSPIPTFEDWVQEMMRIKKSKIPDHYNRLMKYLFFVGGLRLATDVIAEALDRMKKSGDYVRGLSRCPRDVHI